MDADQFEEFLVSMGERRVLQQQSAFERHAQTVLVGLITLIIAWVGWSILGVSEKQNELITEQKVLNIRIGVLADELKDRESTYVKVIDYVIFREQTETRLDELENP